MKIDWDRVDKLALALMHLTSFEEGPAIRAWKGYDWDILKRLHANGWVSDPVSKAKSVVLTSAGQQQALAFFTEAFGERPADLNAQQKHSQQQGECECGCGETSDTPFRPGHDQKLRAALEARVGGLLQLRNLVEALESLWHSSVSAPHSGVVSGTHKGRRTQ